jgi:polysaccharide pyruvyl transferase WcaK-like protein
MASFRAVISGYYGFGNVGDEAILAGLLQGFRELAPEATLTVLSGDPAATEAEHGVPAWPRGVRHAASAIRQADLLVSGGGGLLQDATSWRSPLYYLWVLQMARKRGA